VKVSFAAAARVELLEAVVYYEEQRQGLGRDFALEVHEAVRKIKDSPRSCPRHLFGTRRCTLWRFRYGIVYRMTEQEIRVLAIMHLHRKPGYWKNRR
jgi:toxin ParE1/3/4